MRSSTNNTFSSLPEAGLPMDRRDFLRLGLSGTLLLGTVSLGATLAGCGRREQAIAQGFRFLRDADVTLFTALIPVVLSDLPMDKGVTLATLHSIDTGLLRQSPDVQQNLYSLFDLMSLRPMRFLSTGLRVPWPEANAEQINQFLRRWRNSSMPMFNSGHNFLVRVICYAYFAQPAGYALTGYRPHPGLYKTVNS